jgi:hypothetical protein
MHTIKLNDVVVVNERGVNKIGKVTDIGRKNKTRVYTVIMESGVRHTLIQADVKTAMYYVDTELTRVVSEKIKINIDEEFETEL